MLMLSPCPQGLVRWVERGVWGPGVAGFGTALRGAPGLSALGDECVSGSGGQFGLFPSASCPVRPQAHCPWELGVWKGPHTRLTPALSLTL